MEYRETVLCGIGETPLVRVRRALGGVRPLVLLKLECANPSGSSKDRIAVAMIDAAERAGRLLPGGTIVEATSGNTGAAIAVVAAVRGYRCILTVPAKTSAEKIAALRAYGAEVIVAPCVAKSSPEHYTNVAARLARETPGAYMPDQYANPLNPAAHECATGEEIWRQTDGRVTHFVAGVGTGGTICGVARALKAHDAGVTIVGADPAGSVYSGDAPAPYETEGIGRDYVPATLDCRLVDRFERVRDAAAFAMARRVAREDGLLVGGSTGAALVAAQRVALELSDDAVIVVLAADSGRAYLSKIFNDAWMEERGLAEDRPCETTR
jgi:cystathionine beta-synthase